MEPIINPWLIYLAEMGDVFNFLFILLLLGSVVGDLYFGAAVIDNDWRTEDQQKKDKRMLKIGIVVTIISALGLILVPTTDTVYKMIIFNNITTNNIEKGKDYVEDIIDYTAEKLIEVKEGED